MAKVSDKTSARSHSVFQRKHRNLKVQDSPGLVLTSSVSWIVSRLERKEAHKATVTPMKM